MSIIYNYIDQNGIPFKKLDAFSIIIQEDNIINRLKTQQDASTDKIFKKGELIISNHRHYSIKRPDLPIKFNLNNEEQENIVINWLKDTTGFIVDKFQTLFELSELNGKPFLLQVERGGNDFYLVLATKIIDGNITIREKFHSYHGYLQENFIKTFGQIRKINGTLGIDGKITDFGSLAEVQGNVWFSNHIYQEKLESLYPLRKVSGDLNLKNTHACLSSLEEVGGNLNLRKTTCYDLSSLKRVGGNILLSKSTYKNFDFSKVEIKGKIKTFNDIFNHGKLTTPN